MEKQKVSFELTELTDKKTLNCEGISNKYNILLKTQYHIGDIIKFSYKDRNSDYFIIDDMFSNEVDSNYNLYDILDKNDIKLVNELIQLDPFDELDLNDSDDEYEDIVEDDNEKEIRILEQTNYEESLNIKLIPIFVIGRFLKLSSNDTYITDDEVSILYLNVPFEFLNNPLIYDISSIDLLNKFRNDKEHINYDISYINKLHQDKIKKLKIKLKMKLELEDIYHTQLFQLKNLERKYKRNKTFRSHRQLENERFLIHQKLEKLNTTRKHLQQYSKENYPEYRLHESLYPTKKTKKYFKKFW
jgi:hypothetical protein